MRTRFERYRFASLLAVLLTTAACASSGAGRGAVAHHWPSGTAVAYTLTNGQTQTITIPGQGEQVLDADTTFELTLTSIEDATFRLRVETATSVDDAAAGGEAADIADVIGLESILTLNDRGRISTATGLEDNQYVLDQGGIPSFDDLLQFLFLYLPEGDLQEGTTWTREYSYPIDQLDGTHLDLVFIDHYTCRGLSEYEGARAWRIEVTSEAALSGFGEGIDVGISGVGTSVFHAAPGTAMILAAEMEIIMEGSVSIQGMDLPLRMHFRRAARIKE